MRRSLGVGTASCATLIVLGLSPAILSPSLGTVVTIAGLVLLVAFLAVVLRAWSGGSLRREHRDERVPPQE